MKKIACLLIAMTTCSCTMLNKGDSSLHKAVFGLWEEYGPPVYPVTTVTLREENGSYMRKSKKIHDDSGSVVEYISKGFWWISGDHYWEKLTYVSNPMWEAEVGRELKLQILDLSEKTFTYLSSDGATVVEKKIGSLPLANFESIKLKNLAQ